MNFVFVSDEYFLQLHSIPSKMQIKLFVRVKERIKSDQCSFIVTPMYIEIILIKDYQHGLRWNQLEPNEYSESRPNIQLSPTSMHPLSLTNTNLIKNTSNKGKL